MLKIDDRLSIPLDEFRWDFTRSSGPGGQNVNKVNSKVQLRWTPGQTSSLPPAVKERLLVLLANRLTTEGELLVTSQEYRDQARNLDACFTKVRDLVRSVVKPPKTRRATKPTRASQLRRVEDKNRRSQTKLGRRRPEGD
jgi:ribosome-associated protein